MPGDITIAGSSPTSVKIHTNGHDKGRFTIALSGMKDGRKLEPFIAFKGAYPIAVFRKIPDVVSAYTRNGWMKEKLTKDRINSVWGIFSFIKRMFVWDAYRCYMVKDIKTHVTLHRNTDMSIIPGGLTNLVQPANVSWNKALRLHTKITASMHAIRAEELYCRWQYMCFK